MTKVQESPGDADLPDDPAQALERELVAALVSLHDTVSDFFRAESPGDDELIGYGDALSTVAQAAEQAQHLGLADIAVRLDERAGSVEGDQVAELRELLLKFVNAAADYVAHPADRKAQEALLGSVSAGSDSLIAPEEFEILKLMLGIAPVPQSAPHDAPQAEEPEALTQPVDVAVLDAFRQEAQGVLAETIERFAAADEQDRAEVASAAATDLESLIRGAEFTGLTGLSFALRLLQEQLGAGTVECRDALPQLAPAIIGYLEAPTDPERVAWLAAQFPGGAAEALAGLLAGVTLVESTQVKAPRAVTASAADISLELPEDINPELLDGLLIELPVQTAAFARAVQRIVAGNATRQDLVVAKRAAHTLKGAANTVGIRGIATLTHTLEDILLALSDHGVLPNLGLAQTLSYASDCLEAMSEVLAGAGAPPDDALNVLQDVLNWANRIDDQGIEVARGAPAAEAAAGTETETAQPHLERDTAAMLRVPASLIDELLRLVGETMTSTAQIQNRIEQAMAQARTINHQNALLQQLVGELETMVDLRGVTAPGKAPAAAPTAPDDEFDALELEQYNELHTLSRRLAEVATDAREMGITAEEHLANLAELQEAQSRLQLENQKAVMTTRMVPVTSVFSRLQRGVRQACRILDKDVELELRGEGTVMDGNVLQELIEALMHLLRNAVDHGIESVEQRTAAGKPPRGRIELEFRRDGDYIAVRCTDDGRGLDLAAIRANAERHGIIAPDTALSDDETARLILVPGVSTRAEATQVSGRGIGMDAVNSKVLELKGSLHLSSRAGRGLTVELKLPVTLLSTHALMIRVRNKVLAVSTRGIEDIHYISADTVDDIPAGLQEFTTEHYELAELETILDLPGDRRTRGRRGWPVLMVRLVSGALRAVVVQEVLENRSVVVKPLGPYIPRIQGLIGATILGDGSVAAVIDLPDRLYSPIHAQLPLLLRRAETPNEAAPQPERRRVLVVDDSISARRALVQVIRDAGYDVRAAADGLEAIAILEQRVPHLIVTDMEMPRMNGFELAQHVRAADSSRHVPIIMVTSRTTAKHLRQAELAGVNIYLTKPFNDAELLGHVEGLLRIGALQESL
jgi:chemosensory pili system protein ChpA (sensor histidine kinase/response regulator)